MVKLGVSEKHLSPEHREHIKQGLKQWWELHRNSEVVEQRNKRLSYALAEKRRGARAVSYKGKWTKREDNTLNDIWLRTTSKEEIASILPGRSWDAIITRACRLSLGHRGNYAISLKPSEASYLAGILDGEGSITGSSDPKRNRAMLQVTIANTDASLIQWVHQHVGGHVYAAKKAKGGKHQLWTWRITEVTKIYAFLQILRPYLLVKTRQATIALNVANSRILHFTEPWRADEYESIKQLHTLNHNPQEAITTQFKQITVFAVGGFDPLHSGHLSHLEAASLLGNRLIVGINSDKDMIRKKGFCLLPWETRKDIISSLRFVDKVIPLIDEDGTCARTLEAVKPNIFAKGGDRSPQDHPLPQSEIDACIKVRAKIVYNVGEAKRRGWSSTEIGKKALGLE